MQRKLVKQGKGALTVSLPKKWIDTNSLEQGDIVDIEDNNNQLSVTSQLKKVEKILDLDITNLHVKTIQQTIKSTYRDGITELNLTFKNKTAKHIKHSFLKKELKNNIKEEYRITNIVKEIIQDLIGFEIIKQESNQITIKQISKVDEEEFNSTFRRIYLLTLSLNNSIIEFNDKTIIQNKINILTK